MPVPTTEDGAHSGALALPASTGGLRLPVVLHHDSDRFASAARGTWTELSASGHLSPFMCVGYDDVANRGPESDLAVPAQMLCKGEWESVRLMDEMHQLGELSRVDLLIVCTAGLQPEQQAELSKAADDLWRKHLLTAIPDHKPVISHRIWFPPYNVETIRPEDRFTTVEATNVVVVPQDRQFEQAVAMPISNTDPDVYAWHVAVETASLGGLWSTMDGAPVESIEPVTDGKGQPLIRVARSMCRAARIRTPSPEQSLDGRAMLPVTPGLQPVPDSAAAAQNCAPRIFPPSFRALTGMLGGEPAGGHPLTDEPSISVRRDIGEAIGKVLEGGDDATEMATRLDEYVTSTVEAAPWVEPLTPSAIADFKVRETRKASSGDTAVSRAKKQLGESRHPVSIEKLPLRENWARLLDGALGMTDAAPIVDSLRKSTPGVGLGNVIVDPHALAHPVTDLKSAIHKVNGTDSRPADDSAGEEDGRYRKNTPSAAGTTAEQPEPKEGNSFRALDTLLGQITGQFDQEILHSENDVKDRIGQLGDHLRQENRPQPGVRPFVGYVLIGAFLLALFAVLTFTPLRSWFSPNRLSEAHRVTGFLLISLAAALPPTLRLTSNRSWRAQVYLPLVAVAYTGAGVAAVVFAAFIEESPLDEAGNWWAAALVALAVFALATVAWAREFRGDREMLGWWAPLVGDRMAGAVPIAYGFVLAVVIRNYVEPTGANPLPEPPEFSVRSWDWLLILLTVAVVAAATARGLTRIVSRRTNRIVRKWCEHVDELVARSESGAERTEALTVLKAHWLTTAAVLARLVHRPFGSPHAASKTEDPTSAVRKMLIYECSLDPTARNQYLGKLLPDLAPKGWLRAQYRRLSTAFASSERARLGLAPDDDNPAPEHCSYPLSLQSVEEGRGNGARWRFAEQVYSAEFDRLLREAADQALNQAMTVQIEVSLGPDGTDRRSLPALLGELLPDGETRLPAGALPLSVEATPEYESQVWWPTTVPMPEGLPPAERKCRPLHAKGTVLLHAVRVDISELVDLDRLGERRGPDMDDSCHDSDEESPHPDDPDDPPDELQV